MMSQKISWLLGLKVCTTIPSLELNIFLKGSNVYIYAAVILSLAFTVYSLINSTFQEKYQDFLEYVFIAHNSTVLNPCTHTHIVCFTCLSRMKSSLDRTFLWINTIVKVKNDSHAPLLHIGSLRPESDA